MKKYSRRFRSALVGLAIILAIVVPQSAMAQGFELQQFHPMAGQSENFFSTSSAEVPAHLSWSAMALFNYSSNPLVLRNADGEVIQGVVGHQATSHVLLSLGLMDRLELGLDIPVVVMQDGTAVADLGLATDSAGLGIGDIRLVPKVQLYSSRASADDTGFAVAFLVDLHLPTGDGDQLQGGDFRAGPRLALDAVLGGPRLGLNVGYLYRAENVVGNLQVRDTLSWNVGFEFPIVDEFRVTGEAFGRLTPGADEIRRNESPTEFLLGGKYLRQGFLMVAGAGMGLINGYGTPDFRAFAGLGWATPPQPAEEPIEVTPEPEPEPECRAATVAEDCDAPPAATCEEGVLTTYAAACEDGECALRETQTRCASGTHCGEEDGLAACVPEPDCVEDGDCTNVPDRTCLDGVLTTYAGQCLDGSCHYEPTQVECEEDMECGLEQGRPTCVPVSDLVEVDEVTERIEISEVVLFAVNSADIDTRSHRLLNQVAQVLENNPHIRRVRIEGHTDNTGRESHNLRLSQRRANSVRDYLVERGIEAGRLRAVGLGPNQPIEDNATQAGRDANRRVEFHIEERD